MPARARHVTVYSDLPHAGGGQRARLRRPDSWTTTYRHDGDHRLSGVWPRQASPGAALATGDVLVVERDDATVEDWLIAQVIDRPTDDAWQVTALPVGAWFQERVLVRSGTTTALTWSGRLSAVLALLTATSEWPSWCIAGTLDRDPVISVTLDGATGGDALRAILEAAATADDVIWQGEVMRLEYRRVSASQYALDFRTSAAPGTPVLEERRNITPPEIQQDRAVQVQDVVPLGAGAATIADAFFDVRSFSGGDLTVELRDWAYRPDRLAILADGQWVGHYLILPGGAAREIVGSIAATQRVIVTSVTSIGTATAVRISPTSGGAPLVHVPYPGVAARRLAVRRGPWTRRINWLPNAWWRGWVSGSQVRDWSALGSSTVSQSSDVEFGDYALNWAVVANGDTLSASVLQLPDSVMAPGGGTQTWILGCRYKRISGTSSAVLEYSVNGGSSWSAAASLVNDTSYTTIEGTLDTNLATLPNLINVRFRNLSSNATTWRIERVWLLRQGIDDLDNDDRALEGCDPCRGIYDANRHLGASADAPTYQFTAMDRYRADPARWPFARLAVNQLARLRARSRDLDVTLPIVELQVDELIPIRTAVRLGTPRRRLTQLLRA